MHPLHRDPTVKELLRLALEEDRVHHDVTAAALVPERARARGRLVARSGGRVAGLFLLEPSGPLFAPFPGLTAQAESTEGAAVAPGDCLGTLEGPARSLLAIERTLLNFLQRLSGIATETARYVAAVKGTRARIQETRKTCPGWRALDKYAVAAGGGLNHRRDLSDQVLIKENHLVFAGLGRTPQGVAAGVRAAREGAPADVLVEVEVEDLAQLEAALAERPDVIMLDDFADADVARAVHRRDAAGPPPPLIEVSGGIRLERVRELALLGVDRISVGALTHSVQALDIALEAEALP